MPKAELRCRIEVMAVAADGVPPLLFLLRTIINNKDHLTSCCWAMSHKSKGAAAAHAAPAPEDLPFQSLEVEVLAKLQSNAGVLTPNNVSVMEALPYMNAKVIFVFTF
jgi:hypothetical protein